MPTDLTEDEIEAVTVPCFSWCAGLWCQNCGTPMRPDMAKCGEREGLRYFDQSLHRMIQAFAREAMEPLQKVLSDATAMTLHCVPLNR